MSTTMTTSYGSIASETSMTEKYRPQSRDILNMDFDLFSQQLYPRKTSTASFDSSYFPARSSSLPFPKLDVIHTDTSFSDTTLYTPPTNTLHRRASSTCGSSKSGKACKCFLKRLLLRMTGRTEMGDDEIQELRRQAAFDAMLVKGETAYRTLTPALVR
ncbi:hypothetical protein HDU97_003597 [Phlyctochytrium planicorne]|nr:hypothetical protein HDU97_003597 [Phlyctochytrium planicorne]